MTTMQSLRISTGRIEKHLLIHKTYKEGTPYETDTLQVILAIYYEIDAIICRGDIFCKKVLKYELNL